MDALQEAKDSMEQSEKRERRLTQPPVPLGGMGRNAIVVCNPRNPRVEAANTGERHALLVQRRRHVEQRHRDVLAPAASTREGHPRVGAAFTRERHALVVQRRWHGEVGHLRPWYRLARAVIAVAVKMAVAVAVALVSGLL